MTSTEKIDIIRCLATEAYGDDLEFDVDVEVSLFACHEYYTGVKIKHDDPLDKLIELLKRQTSTGA